MQLLYIMDAYGDEKGISNPVTELQKSFDKTRELFVYLIYFLTEVARYAETDSRLRGNRHLPSEADLNVNTKLAGNLLLWQILESPSFVKAVEDDMPEKYINRDLLKKIYTHLAETSEYHLYINENSRNPQSEKEIIKFIFANLMLPNEDFIEHIEELFNNWDDDGEMMEQLMFSYLQKPRSYSLNQMVPEDKWQFAKSLLVTTFNKKTHLQDLIKPKLINWDSERIATLDLIILQMGIAEFLYFETIPTKVTINEYIDLAKDYSTPQSGHFVNGVLDNVQKDLTAAEKINKIEYKSK